jgi:hypothetical protein
MACKFMAYRFMAYRFYGALLASVSIVALTFTATETFARSGAAPGVAVGAARGFARHSVVPSLRHRHRGNSAFWPAVGGYYYEPPNGAAVPDLAQQPAAADARYTYTYDVPWDWAHRFPPAVTPSERAYVSQCPEQTVTVRGKGGDEQTVNIMRCY